MAQSSLKTAPRKPVLPVTEKESELVPASCPLPRDLHAKITAAAEAGERTFAAQLRMIAKEWASRQPAS